MGRTKRALIWAEVRRTPYQIAYAFLSTVYGAVALLLGAGATPNSLDDTMPRWVVTGWCVSLLIGGVCTLWGRLSGWGEIEALGLTAQLGGTVCYIAGCLLTLSAGGPALFGLMSYVSLGSATLIRLSTVREAMRARNIVSRAKGG